MEDGAGGQIFALGPRIPDIKAPDTATMGTVTWGIKTPSRIHGRADSGTECTGSANACEKPAAGTPMTIPIVLGVTIPVVAILSVLIYLHRRGVKKQRREDAVDPHKSLDFGLDDNIGGKAKSKRRSFLTREKDPQSRFNRQQMSMDMNVSSPYLLAPGLQNSRDSLNSLARTLHADDPYRPVAQYTASEAGSIRSVSRGPAESSIYTRSSSRQESRMSRSMNQAGQYTGHPPQNSLPRSGVAAPEPTHLKHQPTVHEVEADMPTYPASADPGFDFAIPAGSAPRSELDGSPRASSPIQEPAPVAQKVARQPTISPHQPSPADSGVDMGYAESAFEKHQSQESSVASGPTLAGLGLVDHIEPMQASVHMATVDSLPVSPMPQRGLATSAKAPIIEEPLEYYDYEDYPEVAEPYAPGVSHEQPHDAHDERGRNMQRQSHLYGPNALPSGLGVPQPDNRRLSVGFRPLPPDEIMESEDPEYRANRIRSFYKEYFEDGRHEGAPPMPPMPQAQQMAQYQMQQQQHQQYQQQGMNYYEDYRGDYQGDYHEDAPYYDPDTNAFVMPYAQPVARRAMTPPPTGQRFAGPRPPRAFHGSMAGMRMPPPGMRGPQRPGSSASNNMGPRPGSSVSHGYGRSRAASAASNARSGPPRKPMPLPMDLNTLPTPAKLKDDSFALLNAIDFAPPESFGGRARGRSQSPSGERRPYKPTVPAHSPLVNAFEELPTLPSPHLLRKSTTFTALDFAPPRKFGDSSDARSETGSIRSNRSGISAVQLGAIRSGAGRVSRLPGDTIFTQAAMSDKLKPQWTMRP
ncbi:hypothetical protein B0T24DRAFT_593095 [Lasiosphaeria ovina]|uniref:Uncharacterized protein n=1 Tax=Lasiosphaeria ovina TaxID=92902 RepID=A0AAE0KB14_9PEZI|nr:hypothetical protein B0T24DRAFT_593095 [Lasiosphaeria ovina]